MCPLSDCAFGPYGDGNFAPYLQSVLKYKFTKNLRGLLMAMPLRRLLYQPGCDGFRARRNNVYVLRNRQNDPELRARAVPTGPASGKNVDRRKSIDFLVPAPNDNGIRGAAAFSAASGMIIRHHVPGPEIETDRPRWSSTAQRLRKTVRRWPRTCRFTARNSRTGW